jgi:hypothetical protein
MSKDEVCYDPHSTKTQQSEDGSIFHCGLQTWVERVEYDWHERYGQVWCLGPVDMGGCINLFTSIDADVRMILSYMDGEPDTGYRKRDGKWEVGDFRLAAAMGLLETRGRSRKVKV